MPKLKQKKPTKRTTLANVSFEKKGQKKNRTYKNPRDPVPKLKPKGTYKKKLMKL